MSCALENSSRVSSMSRTATRWRVLRGRPPRSSGVLMAVTLCGVTYGVLHDVRDVLVGEPIGNLAAAADALNEVRATQDTKVLADQRLREPERLDDFVHAAFVVGE